ncbi:type 1 glutamine amidotransferase domain-containing protein [Staphylococcus sp. EZ-P03]|uniref:type 1 glutamine amidotransferase domain-containing protein n=1 Tax=Staphylococcus sp. EZ-P03 TaxID=2282739 RepID=UPI000DF7DF92|nr:type 1 glutamine amidotransferase domain-containing protein [Staphylococcus sp. EZ-P03]
MKKILVAVTNVSKYKDLERPTGAWLGEVVHFADEFYKAGYEVDYVSPKGGFVPIDPASLSEDFMTDVDWKYYTDHQFMTKLNQSLKPEEVNPEDYEVIYYAGGHGVVWDFEKDKGLIELAEKIYSNNGYVTAVCHGPAGLLNIKDNGQNLIKGKKVAGFSNSEESQMGVTENMPFLLEDALKEKGGEYEKGEDWSSFVVADGRLITGQNPQSAQQVALDTLKALGQ